MQSSHHTYVTPVMFMHTEKRRFDALEPDHLAWLEGERRAHNESRMRFLGLFLAQQGMTVQADDLLAIRNDCDAQGVDAGSDLRIHRLIDDVKHNLADLKLISAIPKPYLNLSDLIDRQNWNRFRSCWKFWGNIGTILDHRLVAITITGRPDGTIVDFKQALDALRDRVLAALRPLVNWYSWHLDVSLLGDSRHPHYHCLFVIPASLDRAVFDAVDELRSHAYWNNEGLKIQYRDWLDYDRRQRMLDVAERQQSWIAALAYVTRFSTYRSLPTAEVIEVPTLSSFLDVDDHVGQIKRGWNTALSEVLKRNDFDKVLGARRIVLFLRKETKRRVISFRQSRRWKTFEMGARPGAIPPSSSAGTAAVVSDEGNSTTWLGALEAAAAIHRTRESALTATEVEHCSINASGELEQNDTEPTGAAASDYDSMSSIVIDKGFKKNPVGRPRRAISHQELMLAIINGGTCIATAALLQTSRRKVREEMRRAGIEPFRRGRPMKKKTFTA